jgi:hypothetical protein
VYAASQEMNILSGEVYDLNKKERYSKSERLRNQLSEFIRDVFWEVIFRNEIHLFFLR